MARGNKAVVGDENVAANGYTYVKTENGWVLKHHLIAKEKFDQDLTGMRIYFIDNDRTNLSPDNIGIKDAGKVDIAKRRAKLEAQIAKLQRELDSLED